MNHRTIRSTLITSSLIAASLATVFISGAAQAVPTVGYYVSSIDGSVVDTRFETSLGLTGYSGVGIYDSSVASVDLSNVDVIYTARYDSPLLSQRKSDLDSWVFNGGVLLIDDASSLPDYQFGGPITSTSYSSSADIGIQAPGNSSLINGPYGTLTNSSLDDGSSSFHNAYGIASLPGNATVFLNAGQDPSKVVGFGYEYGSGYVYYSSIPTYCYYDWCYNNTNIQFENQLRNVYVPNLIAFGVEVAAVPEPETYAMMLAGLGLVGAMARRRKLAKV